jgi:hypothetical protein
MRYLHVRLTGESAMLHPLVPTLTDPAVFRDAKMIDWSPSFDPPRATVLLYLEGDLAHFGSVLADTDLVREYDVTTVHGDRGYAYVHSDAHPTEWRFFETVLAADRLVAAFPIQYHHDGSLSISVVGPAADLQAAVDATPPGVETAIEQVGEYDLGRPPIPPGLSPRQHEALEAALERGYYDVPRNASREEIADALDCAPSTASEHLRKAERHVVRSYLNYRR